jgi:hypothetical protein
VFSPPATVTGAVVSSLVLAGAVGAGPLSPPTEGEEAFLASAMPVLLIGLVIKQKENERANSESEVRVRYVA